MSAAALAEARAEFVAWDRARRARHLQGATAGREPAVRPALASVRPKKYARKPLAPPLELHVERPLRECVDCHRAFSDDGHRRCTRCKEARQAPRRCRECGATVRGRPRCYRCKAKAARAGARRRCQCGNRAGAGQRECWTCRHRRRWHESAAYRARFRARVRRRSARRRAQRGAQRGAQRAAA